MYSMALIRAEEYDRRHMLRIHRKMLRDSTDPFDIPDERFRQLYRLTKDTANLLLAQISPYMITGVRSTFIPQPIRMCAALNFFATGSFRRNIGQDFPASVSRSVLCRSVLEVSDILEKRLMPIVIKFPRPDEYNTIAEKFYEETGFPGVIGVIDCTHIRIKRPNREVESCYLNRKGYYSKNVQLICDFNLRILGGFARFGGSTDDSYIWESSRINALLQQRYDANNLNNSWLLGDSGYALSPWLITPYPGNSGNEEEKHFNTVHAKARNCVERLNGVLKSVFRCLHIGLHTTPQNAGKIINACTVLHNFRLAHGLSIEDEILPEEQQCSIGMDINEAVDFTEPLREASWLRDRLKERICRQINS